MAVIEIVKNVRYGGKRIFCGTGAWNTGIDPVRIAGLFRGNASLKNCGWVAEAEVSNDDAYRFSTLKSLAIGHRDAETLISSNPAYRSVYRVICR